MAIGAKVFLLVRLPAAANLATAAGRGRFGGLAAGIGIYFGIQHQDVDVFAHGKHMVQTAVADIVGPAVAADDPDGFFDQQIAICLQCPSAERLASPCSAASMAAGSKLLTVARMPVVLSLRGVSVPVLAWLLSGRR